MEKKIMHDLQNGDAYKKHTAKYLEAISQARQVNAIAY